MCNLKYIFILFLEKKEGKKRKKLLLEDSVISNTSMKFVMWFLWMFQSLMVFVAVFIVIFGAVYDKGSFSAIWQIAKERERIQFFKWVVINTD